MSAKAGIILGTAVAAAVIGAVMALAVLFLVSQSIHDGGSPELAREWSAVLEQFPDVETAKVADDRVWGKRFGNGQLVFGLSPDSHGSPRTGGTVVLKDSRHGVRVFFGHVCGGPGPVWWQHNFESAQSLDEFYARLMQWRFQEHVLTDQ